MGATLLAGPAPPAGARVSARVGEEIRLLRKRQRMTLLELSRRTHQSTGHLSQIERGISIPSVSAIDAIAGALGVRVTWFFEAGEVGGASEDDVVVRKGARRRLTYATGISDQLLSPRLNGPLEMFLATFAPGSGNGEEWLAAAGYQGGLVLCGRLRLILGKKTYELAEGDSFGFEAGVRHRYMNPGEVEARVLWVFIRPDD